MVKKSIKHYSVERARELHGFAKLLYNRPILKFLILLIIYFILNNIVNYFPRNFPVRILIDIIGILIFIYFVAVLIYIVRKTLKQLFNPKNILSLIFAYALFILGIILLFSTIIYDHLKNDFKH